MYRHILAPVDFSPLSAGGLRYAAALARRGNSRLTALFADPFTPPPYFTESRMEALAAEYREAVRDAELRLRRFVEEHAPGAAAMVVEALPVDAIISAVEALQADLIAMGTHGSVAEKVLRQSPVPVLTVGPRPSAAEVRRILVPVNDSAAAREALAEAAAWAAGFQAALTVLHVQEDGARDAIADLCAWVPASERARCEIREITRQGDAAERIVEAAAQLPADLLVLGARVRPFGDATVLGSTTARVVRHAPCAVLTVRHRRAAALHSGSEARLHAV